MRQQRTACEDERPQGKQKSFVWILTHGFCLTHNNAVRDPKTNHAKKVAKWARTREAVITRGQAGSD